jgi:hypothetical protein
MLRISAANLVLLGCIYPAGMQRNAVGAAALRRFLITLAEAGYSKASLGFVIG